ncbi:MAG TPA: MBL fold metallo-hydrolase [Caulobacteraceae bacterium]|nr:MBL fold metallo-hydrolase [Caulobacteraceae bacterium]
MSLTMTVHGAAGCVTGSCYRLATPRASVLVDCGMFQGSKSLKALNYEPFPFDAKAIDAVLLTHAHIDHSGLLPKLVRAGFSGPIYATAGTRDLCDVMLADAAHIQESEVEQLNRRNERRGRPTVEPIYTRRDAARTMELFQRVKLGEAIEAAPGFTARWWNAGHILGSASIEVVAGDEAPARLLFSGDLGPGGRDFLADPEGPAGVDHLIMESTYGDRERPAITPDQRRALLAAELRDAHDAGGPLLIPAFAVERTQELLADLLQVMADGAAPPADVFLDSPLAVEATEVFLKRGYSAATGRNPFEALHAGERLRFLREPRESDQLERLRGWHVIMAASGMCDAGRIRKHLKRLLWRESATVLLSGFQVRGTLGRLLLDGVGRVRIQGDDIQVKARIRSLDIYSGHADASGLAAWALARRPVGGKVFVCHGEPEASRGLATRLEAAGFAPDALALPTIDQAFRLAATTAEAAPAEATRHAPAAPSGLDWHNARARLLGELDARLERADSDAERAQLLEAIRRLLEAPTASPAAVAATDA